MTLDERLVAALAKLNLAHTISECIVSNPDYYIDYEPVTKTQYVEYLERLVQDR